MTNKALTPRQVRWANFLSQFNFTVKYRPGKLNGKADYLSRMPGVMPRRGGENLQHRLQRILKDDNLDPELRKIAKDLAETDTKDPAPTMELNALVTTSPLVIAVDDVDQPTLQNLMDQAYRDDPEPGRILQALDRNERRLG